MLEALEAAPEQEAELAAGLVQPERSSDNPT